LGAVFVTGGAGYVGSHACKAFAAAGRDVTVYDNLSRGWRDFVKWGPLVEGDILDTAKLTAALKASGADTVVHFAAVAYIAESIVKPDLYYRINVAGTVSLLQAMLAAGVKRIVFSSSCATYGVAPGVITEATPQQPINPYGRSKQMAEQAIRDAGPAHGIESVILRYFNAGGSDPDREVGERHEPEPHVIPLAIRGAMDGGFTFTINGDDFDTPDGTCVRDYVHVCDLADAHVRAVDHLGAGRGSDIFNLSTGSGASVLDLIAAIEGVTGGKIQRKAGPRRPGDPPSLVASHEKAARVLGWRATRSDLPTLIADAWGWLKQDGLRTAGNDLDRTA
jgi:UDP-arabinose 4-epimerase